MLEVLPGFREFYPEDCAKRNFIFRSWKDWARRFDFTEYDIPTLEPLELFTRKSGPEIVGQLFAFEDQGGRAVALRPELTPSLARMVGSRINALKRPVKWFNIAENFRYERQQKGRLRSHYQFNADIFGEPGEQADAEIMALVLQVLMGFGLGSQHIRLRLSDRQLWSCFLEGLGFGGESGQQILALIDKMERLSPEEFREKLREPCGARTDAFLAWVEAFRASRDLGSIEMLARGHLEGEILERALARLDNWRSLMGHLEASGMGDLVVIDLGIVRGLAYYTGYVFEVFTLDEAGKPTGRALAGGGRYDHLVGLLGFPEVHAVGFGMGDVVLQDTLEAHRLMPPLVDAPDLYMVCGGGAALTVARADATRLRAIGMRVRHPLKAIPFGKQFRLAGDSGARLALIYGEEEVARGVVKVRDLSSGEEQETGRDELINAVVALTSGADID
ncbi:MAG: hypothetical protein RL648_815 [Verrucomicrobiota bacterium]